jgi:hypothetical protein
MAYNQHHADDLIFRRFGLKVFAVIAVFLILVAGYGFACNDDERSTGLGKGSEDTDDGEGNDSIPQFVTENYIDLDSIARISRFRSGVGHSYTDNFETCRSMKHYFVPKDETDWTAVKIFSPVDGTVVKMEKGWAGMQIRIESEDHPGLFFILFHVNTDGLSVGESIKAGQQLGVHIGPQTWSDIAVGHDASDGWRLLSWFDLMSDGLFKAYQDRGLESRIDAIISTVDREEDLLICNGEEFASEGNLENWVELE